MKPADDVASGDAPEVSETLSQTGTAATVETRKAASPVRVEFPPKSRGERIGRYIVIDVIGRGGMGIVYKAYDPDLDRSVALKLLRPRVTQAESHTAGRDRMLREAQALAQLSHPNVVSVYDVGVVDDDVFVAMEHVDGVTLRSWIKDRPPVDDVVRAFAAAGDGLAAAHRAGLLHGDFKPENVMLGHDGRVRVLDFGLARPVELDSGEFGGSGSASAPGSGSLTEADVVVGTPPYMAPEQYRRERALEHTDQYSFCVSLFEVLYGARPFPGRKYRELKPKVLAGEVAVPDGGDVPARIARIIQRGMSFDPADRYGSMDALLEDLRHDPAIARRRIAIGVGAVGLAAVAVFAVARGGGQSASEQCAALSRELDPVWNAGKADALGEAFRATQRPFAARAAELASSGLDDYRDRWSAMRVEACEATRVRGVQSDELLDLRMSCLDRRRDAMAATVALLLDAPDAATVEHAVDAVSRLPAVAECADAQRLRAGPRPPEGSAERAEADAVRRDLAKVEALLALGRYVESVEPARASVARAEQLGQQALLAEALRVLGNSLDAAGEIEAAKPVFERALHVAAAADDQPLLARLWMSYAEFVGNTQERYDDALAYIKVADVALSANGSDRQRVWLLSLTGAVLEAKGDLKQARAVLEEALRLQLEADPESTDVAITRDRLSTVLKMMGEYADARAQQRMAIETYEKRDGPDHPRVAALIYNLGLVDLASGNYDDAERHLRRAHDVMVRALGDEHPTVAVALSEIANVLREKGEYDGALEAQQRALEIRKRTLGPDHPSTSFSHHYLGELLIALERYDEARPHLERAIEIRERSLKPNHPQLGEAVAAMGELLWAQDRLAEARPYYERTRDIYAVAYGERHPFYAIMLLNLGDIDLALGDAKGAVPNLETAVEVLRASEGSPTRAADAEFVLAKALWATGKERARARTIARRARDAYASADEHYADSVAAIDAWLRKH